MPAPSEYDTLLLKLTPKQRRLFDLLPQCDYNYPEAALKAGYNENYARTKIKRILLENRVFVRLMNLRDEKNRAGAMNEVDKLQRFFTRVAEDESQSMTTRLSAADKLAKMLGVYSEKRTIESSERRLELDAAQRQEIHLLTAARLRIPIPSVIKPQYVDGQLVESVSQTVQNNEGNTDASDDNASDDSNDDD